MKRRLFLLLGLVLGLGLAAYGGGRFLREGQKLRRYVEERVLPFLGEGVSVQRVRIRWRTIVLEGLEMTSRSSRVALYIPEARVSYSLSTFLFSGFDPASAAREIALIRPRLTLVEGDGRKASDGRASSLPGLPRVKALIFGGEIYARWSGDEVKVASDLSGWIDGRTRGIGLHLIGRSNVVDGDLTIEGVMDRGTGAYDIGLEGACFILSPETWPSAWTRIVPEDGQMGVTLHLSGQDGASHVTGEIRIWDGHLKVQDPRSKIQGDPPSLPPGTEDGGRGILNLGRWTSVDSLNLEARVEDSVIWIQRATGWFEGQQFEGTGRVKLFSRPRVALDLRWPAVDMSKVGPIHGQVQMAIRIQGGLDSLYVQGGLRAERVSYRGLEIEGIQAEFTASDSLLRVQHLKGRIGEQGITAEGWIGLKGEQWGHLSFEARDMEAGAVLSLLSACSRSEVRDPASNVSHYPSQDGGEGTTLDVGPWTLDTIRGIKGHGDLVLTIDGKIARPNWRMHWKGESLFWNEYRITGVSCSAEDQGNGLRFSFGSDQIHANGEVSGTPGRRQVNVLWSLSDLRMGDLLLRGQGEAIGEPPALAITGDLFLDDRRRIGGKVHVEEGSFRWDGERPQMRVEIGAHSLSIGRLVTSMKGRITADTKGFDFGLRISNLRNPQSAIRLDGRGEWEERPTLEARLVGEHVPLSEILAAIGIPSRTEAIGIEGLVDGSFTLRGPWNALDGSGTLRLTDGRMGTIGGIGGEITLLMHQGQFGVENGFLQRAGHVLASLEGTREGIWVTGRDLDAGEFFSLFHERGSAVHGWLKYQVSFSRALHVFKGNFEVIGGAIGGMRFDHLEGKLSGDVDQGATTIHFQKKGQYKGSIEGKFPLDSRSTDLDLTAHLEGPNVLSLAPALHRAVARASGAGTVDLGIGGSWSAPRIRRLHIRCTGGELVPEVLVDRITRLEGELRLQPGDDFVQIQRLAGEVEGRPVWATNVDTDEIDEAPLTLGKSGLHLGRVLLHTTEQGIDLTVPGIMWPEDRARVELRGKGPEESFYVEGPNEAPTLCGVVVVKSGDVTYPPLPNGSRGRSGEMNDRFLEAIRWDLDVVAGEDMWYILDTELMGTRTHLKIREGDRLSFHGSFKEGDFWVEGRVRVDRGTVSYMDSEFDVEQAGMEVDSRYGGEPVLYGRARMTTYDEAGIPTNIYLRIYAVDKETGARMEKGPWSRILLNLQSDDPDDDSLGKILQQLGYAPGEYNRRALGTLIIGVEKCFLRPLLTPVERELRKALRLDVVRFRPSIARNLLIRREILPLAGDMSSDLALFRGTQLTVGDVLSRNWFLSYTGQLEAGLNPYQKETLGIKHQFCLEYQLWSNTRLHLEYEVDSRLKERDRQIRISHWFPF